MEIPKDIMAAAVAVVDRGYDTGLIDAVAAALMEERERCAKVLISLAEGYESQKQDGWQGQRSSELRYAAAILLGPQHLPKEGRQ